MRESTIKNQPLNCNSFYPFPTPQKNNPPNLHLKAWKTVVTPIVVWNIGVLKQHVTKNHSWVLFGVNNNVNNQIIWTGEARARGNSAQAFPQQPKTGAHVAKPLIKSVTTAWRGAQKADANVGLKPWALRSILSAQSRLCEGDPAAASGN